MVRSFCGIGMTSQRTRDRLIQQLRQEGISDERVLGVLRELPRHIFVDEALAGRAYENTALPVGHGQTISQPFIVARMTAAIIADRQPDKILEIGTGCGYQTAVLAKLAGRVFSVERIGALSVSARERLWTLGINNVHIKHGDGNEGWVENAPYDGIMVTAAPVEIPKALLQQLTRNGRMVIPVGAEKGTQKLLLITRSGRYFDEQVLDDVIFVPMLSGFK
uniref:Protein-L-isoaspartate O-methyltransferase n=1 Tax=Candidatus Kentrum sp. MB TaxID=2138164 RepID=A0A450XH98_9GAMM|nr:MAG: protein-L-isoaspartate(D-aspartate) O-methyltransferase [Candidatus Kentron sp. MB]VFK32218.1 MAG: protein-L-isoaspartate(D-aspartate) O-methyltransferase [Candidatus Kentron sp. MB]VFK75755.1 MAG: protein-L-isoaspartate(D-aspartate) O-methyltransferase [Candidatus Kentron sp. MB]